MRKFLTKILDKGVSGQKEAHAPRVCGGPESISEKNKRKEIAIVGEQASSDVKTRKGTCEIVGHIMSSMYTL